MFILRIYVVGMPNPKDTPKPFPIHPRATTNQMNHI